MTHKRGCMTRLSLCKAVWLLCVFCGLIIATSSAQTVTNVVNFSGTPGGALPFAGLVEGTSGNIFGATLRGGPNTSTCIGGCGTVFKIVGAGQVSILHSFCALGGCTDGTYPYGALVQAANGSFYGTTFNGGLYTYGTVFQLSATGTLTTIYNFNVNDGSLPYGGLVQGADGNLYGTTLFGGPKNYGTIFKITPAGTLTTLYTFCAQTNCTDGEFPYAALVQGTDGNLYGTTAAGGTGAKGTVFRINKSGSLTTLYNFCSEASCTDGYFPYAGLIEASDGNFYGTTYYGGSFTSCGIGVGCGTVYRISTSGTLTTLHSFSGADGQYTFSGLVQATDGNLYGTTYAGGANGDGTLFEISMGGALTTLHSFTGTDGQYPVVGLTQATNGQLYGTAIFGGSTDNGTVFTLNAGLGPFVEVLPSTGKVGSSVTIFGNNLTGTTKVTFNGTSATFTLLSASAIKATVPTGATSGTIQVTTPKGTLSSNVTFRVQ